MLRQHPVLPWWCEELLGDEGGEEGVCWEEAVTDLPLGAAHSPTLAESELAGKARHVGGLWGKSTLASKKGLRGGENQQDPLWSLRSINPKACAWCYTVDEGEKDYPEPFFVVCTAWVTTEAGCMLNGLLSVVAMPFTPMAPSCSGGWWRTLVSMLWVPWGAGHNWSWITKSALLGGQALCAPFGLFATGEWHSLSNGPWWIRVAGSHTLENWEYVNIVGQSREAQPLTWTKPLHSSCWEQMS